MTAFFVPGVEPDQAETRYAQLAATAGAEAASEAERVRSLRFVDGAEEWTATVGDHPSGQLAARTDRRQVRRASSSRSAPTREVSDPATVLAIFVADDGFRVVTDARPAGPVTDSTWDNPRTVPRRDVRRVDHFDG